jgi:hypothetical protein
VDSIRSLREVVGGEEQIDPDRLVGKEGDVVKYDSIG